MNVPENPPAFPFSWQWEMPDGERMWKNHDGMALRDWFAGQALIGILANPAGGADRDGPAIVRVSYQMADRMLAERVK